MGQTGVNDQFLPCGIFPPPPWISDAVKRLGGIGLNVLLASQTANWILSKWSKIRFEYFLHKTLFRDSFEYVNSFLWFKTHKIMVKFLKKYFFAWLLSTVVFKKSTGKSTIHCISFLEKLVNHIIYLYFNWLLYSHLPLKYMLIGKLFEKNKIIDNI